MKYCNINDCKWNSRDGMCTYFSFDEDEDEDIPAEEETRFCRLNGIKSPQNPLGINVTEQ